MGLLSLLKNFARIILFAGIFVSAILFLPNLPPHNVEYTSYDVPPTKKFEGPLSLNTKLNNAEKLFENLIKGPESLVYHDGVLYTGVHGGHILKITGNTIVPLVKFGKSCAGLHEEHICGRPLGLFIDSKKDLYAADAYYGIFKVNTTTGEVTKLVDIETPIEGRKPKLFNSITVAKDGKIYWTDSDSNFDLKNLIYSIFAGGTGRLIKYDPVSKTNTVLMDRLHFSNGVALSPDESQIFVSETNKFRVLRYHLKGTKKGKFEVVVDGLPGFPDNIKADKQGNMYVSLVLTRDDDHSLHIFRNIGKYPLLRKFLSRVMALTQNGLTLLDSIFPHTILKKAIHAVGHCETMQLFVPSPRRVTIVKLNQEGHIIESLHALDDRISGISEIEFVDEHIYLGSPFNNYLARVKLDKSKP